MSGYRLAPWVTIPTQVTVTPEQLANAEAEFEAHMGFPAAEARDRIHADLARAMARHESPETADDDPTPARHEAPDQPTPSQEDQQ